MIIRIASHRVISEVVDDEAIIIDSLSGAYYSLDLAGSTVWSHLMSGPRSTESLERLLVDRFGVDESVARIDVLALVGAMLDDELVEVTADLPVDLASDEDRKVSPYTTPTLSKYTDMEELLLLDPIHDVDAQGWPIARDDA